MNAERVVITSSLPCRQRVSGLGVDTEWMSLINHANGDRTTIFTPQEQWDPDLFYIHNSLNVAGFSGPEDLFGSVMNMVTKRAVSSAQIMDRWAIRDTGKAIDLFKEFNQNGVPVIWWLGSVGSITRLRDKGYLPGFRDTVKMFVCISGAIMQEGVSYGIPLSQLVQIPPVIDDNVFYPIGIEQKEALKREAGVQESRIFSYVGRFDEAKGVFRLARMWQEMRLPDARLILMGGSYRNWEYFESFAQDNPSVTLRGYGDPREVANVLRISDAIFAPGLEPEGFCQVCAQAVACDIPVVASPVYCSDASGTADFLRWKRPNGHQGDRRNAIMCSFNNPGALAATLDRLPYIRPGSGLVTLRNIGATYEGAVERWGQLYQTIRSFR